LFPNGRFSLDRLKSALALLDNDTSKLVIDLSCRRREDTWFVAMNKWQTITEMEITKGTYTTEFLHHSNREVFISPPSSQRVADC
jgi:phosphoribosylformimino-5-aminoimidazole carboxamide ribotide isomerase